MAEKKAKRRVNPIVSGLNKGLVADVLGTPVDMVTGLVNAPVMAAGYLGSKLGLLDADQLPQPVTKPVGGSEWFSGLLESAGMANPDDEDVSLGEDVTRLVAGVAGPGAAFKAPAAARGAGRVARKAAENLAAPREAGMRASQRGAINVIPEGKRGRTLEGLPAKVVVDGREEVYGGYRPAQEAAERYMRDAGLSYDPPQRYMPVDEARAARIADEYERMPHAPEDPAVQAAYKALAEETMGQYEAARRAGMRFDFMPPEGDPYGNPRNALKDIYQNDRLLVYPTDAGFGSSDMDVSGNPLLALTGEKWGGKPVRVNDVFRGVHDYFGHAKQGVGFRAGGEENAWQQHAAMYGPEARRAATTETRGQNSWLNFGPHGARNRSASTADTIFADQKTGLLPEWVSQEGYGGLLLPRYLLD